MTGENATEVLTGWCRKRGLVGDVTGAQIVELRVNPDPFDAAHLRSRAAARS